MCHKGPCVNRVYKNTIFLAPMKLLAANYIDIVLRQIAMLFAK